MHRSVGNDARQCWILSNKISPEQTGSESNPLNLQKTIIKSTSIYLNVKPSLDHKRNALSLNFLFNCHAKPSELALSYPFFASMEHKMELSTVHFHYFTTTSPKSPATCLQFRAKVLTIQHVPVNH